MVVATLQSEETRVGRAMTTNRQKELVPHLARTVVLVGLMGAGKSSVGRRLAEHLGLRFIDSDDEIVAAAGMQIPEIFERFGEEHFRDGERRVLQRLLDEPPCILATGGGAFMNAESRKLISDRAVSVWIRADLETLWDRVQGKQGRPLLLQADPKGVLAELMERRYPVYGQAEITVDSHKGNPHSQVLEAIRDALIEKGVLTYERKETA